MSWRSSKLCFTGKPDAAEAADECEMIGELTLDWLNFLPTDARQTGANSSELAGARRWGSSSASPAPQPAPPSRDAAPEPPADGPRKRRSRWGNEADKVNLAGLPTAISSNVQSR